MSAFPRLGPLSALLFGLTATTPISVAQTAWHRVVEMSPGLSVKAVSADTTHFVAVAKAGLVLSSTDGLNWSERDSGTFETLNHIERFANGFVALGGAGSLFHSPDGDSWTQIAGGAGTSTFAVTDSLMLVVSQRSADILLRSTDGKVWHEYPFGSKISGLKAVDGRFYAVNTNGDSFSSLDGIEWTTSNFPSVEPPSIVAVGTIAVNRRGRLERSVDGQPSTPIAQFDSNPGVLLSASGAIAYDNGHWLTSEGFHSTDGLTWSAISPLPVNGSTGSIKRTVSIANGHSFFIGLNPTDNTTPVWAATDYTHFTLVAELPETVQPKVHFANGVYLIRGTDDRTVHRSTDGSTWTTHPTALPVATADATSAREVTSDGTHFWLNEGGRLRYASTDGIAWTEISTSIEAPEYANHFDFSHHRWVAWTENRVWMSPNTATWTELAPPNLAIQRAYYSGDHLVVVGTDQASSRLSFIATLNEAGIWIRSPFPTDANFRGIAGDGEQTFAVLGSEMFRAVHDHGPTVSHQNPTTEVTILENQSPNLSVTAASNLPLTYQWARHGIDIVGANQSTLTTPLISNSVGSLERLTVKISDGTHIVTVAFAVRIGSSAPPSLIGNGITETYSRCRADGLIEHNFYARFSGPQLTYQWYRDDIAIPDATTAYLSVITNLPSIGHRYSVRATNLIASVSSESVEIVATPPAQPTISAVPNTYDASITTYLIAPIDSDPALLQWRRNGEPIPGANWSSLQVSTGNNPSQLTQPSGFYDVVAFNAFGATVSATYRLQHPGDAPLPATTPSYPVQALTPITLSNLSVRGAVGSGADVLVAGIALSNDSQLRNDRPFQFLARTAGPALIPYGVAEAMTNPQIQLRLPDGTLIAENTDWQDQPSDLAPTFSSVGAFAFASASHDAALSHNVPATGASMIYTATVQPTADTADGEALVELYALPDGNGTRIANLSARGRITPARGMTAGFVITGHGSLSLLIRAVGSGLKHFGLTDVATAPQLVIRDATGTILGIPSQNGAYYNSTAAFLGGFPVAFEDQDAALYAVNLAPGSYTVTANSETAGIVLLEIYSDIANRGSIFVDLPIGNFPD